MLRAAAEEVVLGEYRLTVYFEHDCIGSADA
jgi:hypothetical protein